MVGTPTERPVAIPVVAPIGAIVTSLLLHVPVPVALVNVVVRPTHTVFVPLIAAGSGLTVTIIVLIQPVGSV